MNRKHETAQSRITRQQLADPHAGVSHKARLKESGAVDLRKNQVVTDHGNGYATTRPIDNSKRFTRNG